MIVTITQAGGFAGLEQRLPPVDTGDLEAERAEEVERSVEELARAVETDGGGPIGADFPTFTVEVRQEQGVRELRVVDDGDLERPPVRALHRLLDTVRAGT